ncbi:hypothetical protein FDH82_gp03 [Roseobacter phage RDJL Phi 2]|uniref:Uncharacterized protein n=1 Tax=Roseobacter phage RDJL Phi 2 TaxID=1682380 RepID=A0A0K0PWK4_9CAUD|nr:hypothetical protein FDH82_gp03 [Roseobacter phage RDJL Phi 2]AKQ75793.1 hypothetical protein RDJLphi2_gp03 [Roseobacter phage RDJL Phi 2]
MDEHTRVLVKQVADEAARKAVAQTLTSLGVDANDPFEVQKDMQALREIRDMMTSEEFKSDMMHLRKWRVAMDGVQNKGILAVVGLAVSGVGAALWLGFQAMLRGGN